MTTVRVKCFTWTFENRVNFIMKFYFMYNFFYLSYIINKKYRALYKSEQLFYTNWLNSYDCIPLTSCFTIVSIWLLVMYSEFEIALAMAIVWGVVDDLIHTLPFIPTVHSKGKYFPRHFRRTNSLLRSLQEKNGRKSIQSKHYPWSYVIYVDILVIPIIPDYFYFYLFR